MYVHLAKKKDVLSLSLKNKHTIYTLYMLVVTEGHFLHVKSASLYIVQLFTRFGLKLGNFQF